MAGGGGERDADEETRNQMMQNLFGDQSEDEDDADDDGQQQQLQSPPHHHHEIEDDGDEDGDDARSDAPARHGGYHSEEVDGEAENGGEGEGESEGQVEMEEESEGEAHRADLDQGESDGDKVHSSPERELDDQRMESDAKGLDSEDEGYQQRTVSSRRRGVVASESEGSEDNYYADGAQEDEEPRQTRKQSSPMEEERDHEVVRDVFGDSDEDEPAPYRSRHEIDEESHRSPMEDEDQYEKDMQPDDTVADEDMRYESDENRELKPKEKPVGPPLDLVVPFKQPPARPDKMNVIKVSNIMGIDPKPFDPKTYVEEDVFVTDESGTKKRIRLEDNIVRWRTIRNADGTTSCESNARFVKWKDGSMLSPWHPLLSPVAPPAMELRSPLNSHNCSLTSSIRPPPPRSLARAPPTLSATAAAVSSLSATSAAISSPSCPKKKVLVPIAMGTEEMEAVIIAGVLRRASADVTLASVEDGLEVEASCGSRIIADTHIASCADQVFDLVALPGGMPGSVRLRDSDILQRITVRQAEEKRLYGAICAAPAVVLVPWGLHRRKKITCHPSFIGDLPAFRAVESNVQVSGELTTSRGPGTTFQFALSFVEQLFGLRAAEDMDKILMAQTHDGLERSAEVNELEWSCGRNPDVLIPIANGCEELEIIILVDILRRAKINVVLASVEKYPAVLGSQRMKIVADKSIMSASDSIYDLIILPGGPAGAEQLHRSRILKKLLKQQMQAGRMYGGVCSALKVLQQEGLLEDKTVTAHHAVASELTCQVIDQPNVVIDGNLITGKGLGTVVDFALAIIRKFFGHGRAKAVANGIVFEYPKS